MPIETTTPIDFLGCPLKKKQQYDNTFFKQVERIAFTYGIKKTTFLRFNVLCLKA